MFLQKNILATKELALAGVDVETGLESELSPHRSRDGHSIGGHPREAEVDCNSQQGKGH